MNPMNIIYQKVLENKQKDKGENKKLEDYSNQHTKNKEKNMRLQAPMTLS